MKTTSLSILIVLILLAAPVLRAQRPPEPPPHPQESQGQAHNQPRANHGSIPPPPQARHEQSVRPMGQPREQGHMDTTPHVSNDRWYGHDRPDDKRYHMDHGFPHGRFERFGPGYRYNIVRIDHDHHRFWLPGGFFFDVAAWDWPICADCAGTVATTMSSTGIPTISAGTCSTMHRLEPTCT
jgi:hypothetical protein